MAPSILLVDDDVNFRRALRVALGLEGVVVGEAATLDEVGNALGDRRWDCALIDPLLDSGEGPAVVELLLACEGTGVLACSAHEEVLRPLAGRMPVLAKPFTPGELLLVAGRFLAGRGGRPVERR